MLSDFLIGVAQFQPFSYALAQQTTVAATTTIAIYIKRFLYYQKRRCVPSSKRLTPYQHRTHTHKNTLTSHTFMTHTQTSLALFVLWMSCLSHTLTTKAAAAAKAKPEHTHSIFRTQLRLNVANFIPSERRQFNYALSFQNATRPSWRCASSFVFVSSY